MPVSYTQLPTYHRKLRIRGPHRERKEKAVGLNGPRRETERKKGRRRKGKERLLVPAALVP